MNPVRPVLIAKEVATDGAVEPVVLKVFSGGRTYLAALADQRDRVLEWLEVWVQCSQDLDSSPLARSALIANATHDQQWKKMAEALRSLSPDSFIETNWEATNAPLVVDLGRMAIVRLVHSTSKVPLELCRDDAELKAAGLGAYSSTLERWFYSSSATGERAWFSIQDLLAGDSGERVAVPETGADGPTADFNLGAGLMLLLKHQPISMEGFLRWLSNPTGSDDQTKSESDSPIEREVLEACFAHRRREQLSNYELVLESAFLRVQLWCALIREVHTVSSRIQTPFLNLATDSFRIALNAAPSVLRPVAPFRTVLVHPGDAIAIRLGESEIGFAPLRGTLGASSASPKFGGWVEGSGTMRIRQIGDAGEGRVRLDGVLDGNELRNVAAGSFVWVQTPVDGRSVSFFAKIEGDKGATRAGTAFSAPSVELASTAANRLKAAARHPCQFAILRPVSPVFDVYSLGAIGVRILLTDDPNAVNELVDDIFELASILPQRESVEDLRHLAATQELSDRLRRLLTPPAWAKDASGGFALSENVWFAIVREVIDFVAAEVPEHAAGQNGDSDWLHPLAERLASVEQVAAQLGRLMLAPRADHDEVARIVHSFV
jgi:hypothetical protein